MKKSVVKSSHTRLRIADVLLIEDEENEEDGEDLFLMMERFRGRRGEGCTGIVSRWLSRFRKGKGKRILVGGDEREEKNVVQNVLSGGDLSAAVTQDHQSVAASKNEHDKMTELRTQMEMLLQNFKEELQLRNKNTLVKPSESNDIFVYPKTDNPERPESNCHHSPENIATPYVMPESSTAITISDQSWKCDTPKEEECSEGMDQLQAELEEELDHLQFRLDKEKFLLHPQQQSIEVTVKDTSSSSRSYSYSSGEVIDPVGEPQNASTEVHVHCGVHPYELERRLHEVLEARQEKHISELEAALECSRLKLREKEIEITWWKETTKLISQHIPEPSRHISERG